MARIRRQLDRRRDISPLPEKLRARRWLLMRAAFKPTRLPFNWHAYAKICGQKPRPSGLVNGANRHGMAGGNCARETAEPAGAGSRPFRNNRSCGQVSNDHSPFDANLVRFARTQQRRCDCLLSLPAFELPEARRPKPRAGPWHRPEALRQSFQSYPSKPRP